MNAASIVSIAYRSLRRAPLRSALTTLGVIIGVAAVVATVGIGSGAKARMQQLLSKPQSLNIFVTARLPRGDGGQRSVKPKLGEGLQSEDYDAIRTRISRLTDASLRVYVPPIHVYANGRQAEAVVEGIDVDGFDATLREIAAGKLFTAIDTWRAATVCLVSQALAEELYAHKSQSILGHVVRINGIPFTVLGIVTEPRLDLPYPLLEKDLHVFVPYTSVLRRLNRTADTSMIFQVADIEYVRSTQRIITDLLESRRGERKTEFSVLSAADAVKSYNEGAQTMATLLAAIGAISLIVGGIGIMNIMLVSVAERSREIGIRLAIGTRRRDVLGQFLVEATALSTVGGVLGVAIGVVACWLMSYSNEWSIKVTPASIVVALSFSVAIGILFGYHPARRAADCDPVEALRKA